MEKVTKNILTAPKRICYTKTRDDISRIEKN